MLTLMIIKMMEGLINIIWIGSILINLLGYNFHKYN